ncbi:MAG: sigma-70 family RNA polymerase sigma factor [Myxococcales bacterium]
MSAPDEPQRLSTEALFRRHADFVASFLARLGVAQEDLDDVLQEVFLVVHARGGYVAGPAKPTSYLGAIATRAALSYRRRRSTSKVRSSAVSPDELSDEEQSPVRTLQVSESSRALNEALASLDPVLSATLLLVEQEGESCGAVAEAMGSPVGTVYWRLNKARKLLRQELERRGEGREIRVGSRLSGPRSAREQNEVP